MTLKRVSWQSIGVVFLVLFAGACGGGGGGSTPANGIVPVSLPQVVGNPTMIGPAVGGSNNPSIACNSLGQAYAVWEQGDQTGIEIYGVGFDPASGWGVPHQINDPGPGPLSEDPLVAIDQGGKVDVFWSEWPNYYSPTSPGGSNIDVYSRQFIPGAGWRTVVKDTSMATSGSGTGSAYTAGISLNSNGEEIAVFESFLQLQAGGQPYSQVMAISRSMDGTWATPVQLNVGTDTQPSGAAVQVALNGSGNAAVLWGNGYGGGATAPGAIYSALQAPGGPWKTLTVDGSPNGGPYAVASDDSGNAIAVYSKNVVNNGASRYQLFVSKNLLGFGWDSPEAIGALLTSWPNPSISFNLSGQACLAWDETGGDGYVSTSIYNPGVGWSTPQSLKIGKSESNPIYPKVMSTSNGDFVLVWTEEILLPSSIGEVVAFQKWSHLNGSWGSTSFLTSPNKRALLYYFNKPTIGGDDNLWVIWAYDNQAGLQTIWSNHVRVE